MTSLLKVLLIPGDRRPVPPAQEVRLEPVVWLGTLAWLVAAVVVSILALTGVTGWRGIWVCLAGLALGGFGMFWVHRRRR